MEERSLGVTGRGSADRSRPGGRRPAWYITIGRANDLAGDRSVEALRRRSHAARRRDRGRRPLRRRRSILWLAEEFLGSWLDARPPDAIVPTIGSEMGLHVRRGWRLDAEVHEVKDHPWQISAASSRRAGRSSATG
jgi:hypothetical protein